MTLRRNARALLPLIAAYAVALQAILLAAGGPLFAARDFAGRSICSPASHGESDRAPAGHGSICLSACLACCCGGYAPPLPAAAILRLPQPAHRLAALVKAAPTVTLRLARAHRSRGPPPG